MAIVRGNAYLGANAHAIALGAGELQEYPVIRSRSYVVKDLRGFAKRGHDHGNAAGVVEIAEGHATIGTCKLKIGAGGRADVLELLAVEVAKHGVWLGIGSAGGQQVDVVHNIGASHKQV